MPLAAGFALVSLPLLYRLFRGPTIADRVLASDAFVLMLANSLAIFSVAYGRSIYLDVPVVMVVLSCISTLVVAKAILEGRL